MRLFGLLLLGFAIQCESSSALAQERAPTYAEMRAYVVSKLTDEQIREAHRLAKLDYAKQLEEAAKEQEKARLAAQERYAKCSDIAYRTKNPSTCTPGYNIQPELKSVEQLFELRLMGICNFVSNVQKAKEAGCLPK